MRIGLLTDLHYCSQEVMLGRRYPQLALSRAQQAVHGFFASGRRARCMPGRFDRRRRRCFAKRAQPTRGREHAAECECALRVRYGNHDCTVFAPEEFTRLSGLQIAPCSWVAGDVALHFLNANFDWQGKPYRPGAVDWTQTRLPEEELARVRAAMADTAHRHFFFLHQCLDPGVEQRHILQNAAEINALLQTGRTAAVFQGHYHPGFRSVRNGIPYVTLAALCEGTASSAMVIDTDAFPA